MASRVEGVTAIVLAAGASRRFGEPKLVQELHNGKTLIQSTLDMVEQAFNSDDIFVVCQKDSAVLKCLDSNQINTLISEESELGLSGSIKHATKHTTAERGWLFVLADMPFVKVSTLFAVCEHLQTDNIIQPTSNSGRGNPVAFGAKFASQLLCVSGDTGGKQVLLSNPDKVIGVHVDDAGIHQDIDTKEDLSRWQQNQ